MSQRASRRVRRDSLRAPLVAGKGPLASVPPIAAFVVVIGLFAAGVLVGGVVGAALLGVLALGVAGLLAGTWSTLTPAQRGSRVLVLLILIAVAVVVATRS
ncbi:hypothetical protein EV193_11941 [Herbihabitans rhizosphaerae]|uniref:Uncharacterized protein n=1 Tax=Herbihabitans rhizosphaerae TaxID=1872711 RepID=A0A4Q7KCL2_9PSEU|nr:DUF6703 family protein [Herbihabitans rhizosphaerae]RZS29638.1 hypothetical protein EV193_11941 [Herbihabitans rhizosphaerae]